MYESSCLKYLRSGKDRCGKGQGQSSLLRHKLHHFGVGMTQGIDSYAGGKIQIPAILNVP